MSCYFFFSIKRFVHVLTQIKTPQTHKISMEYTAAAYPQMHQDQNANPNPPQQQPQPQPQPHPISTSLYSSYYYPPANAVAADPQNQHITAQFYNTDPTTSLTPPGVASYTNYPHLAYCFDPNSNTWVAKEAVQQYGSALAAFPAPVVSGWSSVFHLFFWGIFLLLYSLWIIECLTGFKVCAFICELWALVFLWRFVKGFLIAEKIWQMGKKSSILWSRKECRLASDIMLETEIKLELWI